MPEHMPETEKPWAFPVAMTQVDYHLFPEQRDNKDAEDYRGVVRQDDGTLLAIVSKDYKLVPHDEIVRMCDTFFANKNITRKVKLTKGGARMYLTYFMNDISVEIRPGDKVNPKVTVTNSYDASLRIWVEAGAFRLVCSNGLSIGKKLMSKARRHIGDETLNTLIEYLGQAETLLINDVVPQWRQWANILMSPERGKAVINSLKLPDCYKESALKLWESVPIGNKTVWELYNALTYVLSHETEDISVERQRTLEYAVADGFMEALTTTGGATA